MRGSNMKKVFISYSWEDRYEVKKIAALIESSFEVNINIDGRFLVAGHNMSKQIKQQIISCDYVLVFLSPNSVKSEWVNREIYETIHQELINEYIKLIPIVLSKCCIPKIIEDRFYIDYTSEAFMKLKDNLSRIFNGQKGIYDKINYYVLDIPDRGLNIYHTGEIYDWKHHEQLKFHETVDKYILIDFKKEKGAQFKNYILCDNNKTKKDEAINKLKSNKHNEYIVNSEGYPMNDKWAIWFRDEGYSVKGQWPRDNSVW
jgi:hypothetical protein